MIYVRINVCPFNQHQGVFIEPKHGLLELRINLREGRKSPRSKPRKRILRQREVTPSRGRAFEKNKQFFSSENLTDEFHRIWSGNEKVPKS